MHTHTHPPLSTHWSTPLTTQATNVVSPNATYRLPYYAIRRPVLAPPELNKANEGLTTGLSGLETDGTPAKDRMTPSPRVIERFSPRCGKDAGKGGRDDFIRCWSLEVPGSGQDGMTGQTKTTFEHRQDVQQRNLRAVSKTFRY